MPTTINSHVQTRGLTPTVKIINWNDTRVTVEVSLGDSSMTWFVKPLEDESIREYINRILGGLVDARIDIEEQN